MTEASKRVAVYTGSFDPVTLGHLNVIQRACVLFDKVIVGIGVNIEKKSIFSPEERLDLVRKVTAGIGNVEVRVFSGLAVTFVRDVQSRIMVRGIRPLTDVAAEFTMMLANRQLAPEIETVFLMADQKLAHVSSSLIKQLTPLASDEMLSEFVPPSVIAKLREKLERQPG